MTLDEAIKNATENGASPEDIMVCIWKRPIRGHFLLMENPITKERKLLMADMTEKEHHIIDMDNFEDCRETIESIEVDYNDLPE